MFVRGNLCVPYHNKVMLSEAASEGTGYSISWYTRVTTQKYDVG